MEINGNSQNALLTGQFLDGQSMLQRLQSSLNIQSNIDLKNTYKVINSIDPTNNQDLATKYYVDQQIGGVGQPLNQISTAYPNNNNIDMNNYNFNNVSNATTDDQIYNKLQVDQLISSNQKTLGQISIDYPNDQNIDANNYQIKNLLNPTLDQDACTKIYNDYSNTLLQNQITSNDADILTLQQNSNKIYYADILQDSAQVNTNNYQLKLGSTLIENKDSGLSIYLNKQNYNVVSYDGNIVNNLDDYTIVPKKYVDTQISGNYKDRIISNDTTSNVIIGNTLLSADIQGETIFQIIRQPADYTQISSNQFNFVIGKDQDQQFMQINGQDFQRPTNQTFLQVTQNITNPASTDNYTGGIIVGTGNNQQALLVAGQYNLGSGLENVSFFGANFVDRFLIGINAQALNFDMTINMYKSPVNNLYTTFNLKTGMTQDHNPITYITDDYQFCTKAYADSLISGVSSNQIISPDLQNILQINNLKELRLNLNGTGAWIWKQNLTTLTKEYSIANDVILEKWGTSSILQKNNNTNTTTHYFLQNYDQDLSGIYTNRSIVDKQYVDDAIAGIIVNNNRITDGTDNYYIQCDVNKLQFGINQANDIQSLFYMDQQSGRLNFRPAVSGSNYGMDFGLFSANNCFNNIQFNLEGNTTPNQLNFTSNFQDGLVKIQNTQGTNLQLQSGSLITLSPTSLNMNNTKIEQVGAPSSIDDAVRLQDLNHIQDVFANPNYSIEATTLNLKLDLNSNSVDRSRILVQSNSNCAMTITQNVVDTNGDICLGQNSSLQGFTGYNFYTNNLARNNNRLELKIDQNDIIAHSSYIPVNAQSLATKQYVDSQSGGGGQKVFLQTYFNFSNFPAAQDNLPLNNTNIINPNALSFTNTSITISTAGIYKITFNINQINYFLNQNFRMGFKINGGTQNELINTTFLSTSIYNYYITQNKVLTLNSGDVITFNNLLMTGTNFSHQQSTSNIQIELMY